MLANTDGSLYMVTRLGQTQVVRLNQDFSVDEQVSYFLDHPYRMVNLFNDTWVGYNDDTIDLLKVQLNPNGSKTLVRNHQLMRTNMVKYSVTTDSYLFIPYLDYYTKTEKALIGTYVNGGIKFYIISFIEGQILDGYDWDGFLVVFSKENIMLFKPPIDPSHAKLTI